MAAREAAALQKHREQVQVLEYREKLSARVDDTGSRGWLRQLYWGLQGLLQLSGYGGSASNEAGGLEEQETEKEDGSLEEAEETLPASSKHASAGLMCVKWAWRR